ncbi:MAG: 5-dehydro-2-deoxygluconokinase [Firmicutes bacterium]|nr:5-dehydro-2-deoxygluconokinase [Bacillota bacterium]
MDFNKVCKYDIICLGRVAIDFNPVDYFKTLAESDTFIKYVGGSPANIASGIARLNKKAGFIGKVSNDRFGDFVVDYFKKEGIDTSNISRAKNGESLGLTFTEILSRDTSSILMYRNGVADLALSPEDINADYIKSAKILLLSGTALAKEPSRSATLKALQIAKENGVKVVFDIDYRSYSWESMEELSVYYSIVAEKADIIMGSREEYDLTNGISPARAKLSDKEIASYYFSKCAEIVIIKHGKKGSFGFTKSGEAFKVSAFPVEALKSFGGGDGYGSAFLFGLLENKSVLECLELASASASMLVSAHGCSKFMPTEKELTAFIAKDKVNCKARVEKV